MDNAEFGALMDGMGLRHRDGQAWGEVNRRRLVVKAIGDALVVDMSFGAFGGDAAREFEAFLGNAERNEIISLHDWTTREGVSIDAAGPEAFSGGSSLSIRASGPGANMLPSFLTDFTALLNRRAAPEGCRICFSGDGLRFARIGEAPLLACAACFGAAEAESRGAASPARMARGFVGALLGAVIGSAAWVLIGYVGFYASLAGYVIAMGAVKGYQTLKGPANRVAPWIIGFSVLFAVAQAEVVGFALQLVKYAKEEGMALSLLEAMGYLPELLSDPEVLGDMLPNILLGLLFAALGSFRLIKNMFAGAKTPKAEPLE